MARYAERTDFTGNRSASLKGVDVAEVDAALDFASQEAEAFLSSQYKLPLVKWDDMLRRHVLNLAYYSLMSDRGFKPGSSEYDLCRRGYDDAQKYLSKISRGDLHPSGFVDSSKGNREYRVVVCTSEPRGY